MDPSTGGRTVFVCLGMPGNTTQHYPMDVLQQQLIVICVVIIAAVLLLIAILAIVIAAVVDRCRRPGATERGIECRVFLTEHNNMMLGTMSAGNRSQRSTSSSRLGLGYEDMSPTNRPEGSIYETVQ